MAVWLARVALLLLRSARAIAAAAMVGIENTQLQDDLRLSRRRPIGAADATRERLERDLHDGAQQQLVAVRLKLALAADAIDAGSNDGAAMVRKIGDDVEAALEDLRQLAQGMSPPLLARHGLRAALTAAAAKATVPATVHAQGIARYDPEIEAAVYFCCVEALQNAAKHAGPDASVNIALSRERDTLRFAVTDTGVGFDDRVEPNGSGLRNIRDRIGAIGGHATISSTAGRGTSISATIPIQ